jgi:hypothetical protein
MLPGPWFTATFMHITFIPTPEAIQVALSKSTIIKVQVKIEGTASSLFSPLSFLALCFSSSFKGITRSFSGS